MTGRTSSPTMHVLTPTFRPAGGVVKIFDYVTHALSSGYGVSVWCPQAWSPDLPLFRIDRFTRFRGQSEAVRFHSNARLSVGPDDFIFFSLPDHFEVAYRALPAGMSPERVIHIVQNVRHVTPSWRNGYALRLLTRPLARISINDVVAQAIDPWLDPRAIHEVIPIGHEIGYFTPQQKPARHRPLRVAHTSWKSDLGFRVQSATAADRFEFRAISHSADWSELRDLYHWADVFLCTPGPEEGFYMPGLEAMESGCIVISPDVGGNMAYCRPGENCLLVDFEDVAGYVSALEAVVAMSDDQVQEFRRAASDVVGSFDLASERRLFDEYLARLRDRTEKFESSLR